MILLVGATGLLGGMITRQLLAQGKSVRILVWQNSPSVALAPQGMATTAQSLIDAGAQPVAGDLKDRASLAAACSGIDTVITTANAAMRAGEDTFDSVDLQGTKNLIDAAQAAGVRHFVYTSTFGSAPNHPNPLFAAKGQCEAYLKASGLTIARSRSNRTYYRKYVPSDEAQAAPGKGHPTWYGERFALADAATWHPPDETLTFPQTSRRGKAYTVAVQAWHNLVMTGKTKPKKLPMQECPFTLVRIVRYDQEGKPAFKQPLWLIVMGDRRAELALVQIYEAYAVRFDIEHFFRFGKQKLLMVAFQTPEVEREEKWFQLTHIAYAQLWMARHLVHCLPRPWERNLLARKQRLISPTLVQRDFGRIIRHFGTPARPPKPRHISSGRPKGTILPKRTRHPVVVKGKIAASTA